MSFNTCIVIPSWNGKEYLGECLKSLLSQSKASEIIVVDNGSTDDSVGFIKRHFPKVDLVELNSNHGFAGGVNAGIKRAMDKDCEFVALLNNDAVVDKNWLKNLVSEMKNSKVGIVTGKLMRSDRKHIDSTGEFYTTNGISFPRGRNELDNDQYDKPEEVFGASGGASLYRIKMLQEIGLFDENFFAYFEDVDISFRARLAGWEVRYTPTAVAYHHIGGTSRRLGTFTRYHSVKNITMLYNKNMPAKLWWKYLILYKLQLARMLFGSIRDRQLGAYLHGLWSAFIKLPRTLAQRSLVQKTSKLSTTQVDSLLFHGRPPKTQEIK